MITPAKLALSQKAFREFHARCFWFMRPDAEIVAEEVPYICERLRADGGPDAVSILAAEIAPRNLFEKELLRLLAANRNPESYIAGATVFLRREDSYRQSQDIDVFHDTVQTLKISRRPGRRITATKRLPTGLE